jgi:chaperonin GroES
MAYDAEHESADEDRGEVSEDPQLPILQMAASGENIAKYLEDSKLAEIGSEAVRLYKLDRDSMSDWIKEMDTGIDLAKLVAKEKTYPWKKASNVRFPLITTAALQFNARAYGAIVPSDGAIVKGKVFGADAQGKKSARADRIAAHMSWQLISEIEEWEEETDRLLVQLPIVGTMFRKVWYDEAMRRPRCSILPPGALIVNDKVTTLADAPRITQEFSLYPYELATKRRSGSYRDIDYIEIKNDDNQEAQGFIEQHLRLDLDDDGYEEPYIVVIHRESEKVARIVGDFRPEDIKAGQDGIVAISANTYFVPYHFMPSIDGGFWGTGFGRLLGGTSEAINSLINLMLDAGHMAAMGGGFLGSEFRIKGGSHRMEPGKWTMTTAKGADIRSSVVPMTFPGADSTLFQLLGLLIDSGKDVAGIKDVLLGDTGGRAQTATTTLALIEQGMQQFTAIYKRVYRSLRQEFKLLARINAETVDPQTYNAFHDEVQTVPDPQTGEPIEQPAMFDPSQEYGAADMDICPVADPLSVTKAQEAAKAQIVMELAQAGMADQSVAAQRILEAASIDDIEELLPKPPAPEEQQAQQMMQQMQMESAQTELMNGKVDIELKLAKIESERASAAETMSGIALEQFNAKVNAVKTMMEDQRAKVDQLLAVRSGGMAGQQDGAGGMGGAPQAFGDGSAGLQGSVFPGQPMAGSPQGSPAPFGFGA